MEPLNVADIPERALLVIDSAPIIYFLEKRPTQWDRFKPLFEAHASGRVSLAVTTMAIAEVMTGPLLAGNEAVARRYRTIMESWQVIPLDIDIAETAARLRASEDLELPDAVQAASALAVNAFALVTHDRDFSRVRSLRVLS
jgi:predicted nucleic acid-binding protein